MKKLLTILTVLVLFALVAFRPVSNESIAIGSKAPKSDMKLDDISGKALSLVDMKKTNGLLVIFSCNTCPFVVGSSDGTEGWEGRYDELKGKCDRMNIGMVLVNSNEAKRANGDDLESMKKRATEHNFDECYYVLDKNSELANAFGAKTTPHVYLFDKSMELCYKGAIDDNVDDASKVTQHWLSDAMTNSSSGKKIDPAETKPMGCSIKRVVQN